MGQPGQTQLGRVDTSPLEQTLLEFEVSVEVEVGVEFEVEYEGKGVAIDGSA